MVPQFLFGTLWKISVLENSLWRSYTAFRAVLVRGRVVIVDSSDHFFSKKYFNHIVEKILSVLMKQWTSHIFMVFLATILPINGKYYPSVSRYKSEPYYFFCYIQCLARRQFLWRFYGLANHLGSLLEWWVFPHKRDVSLCGVEILLYTLVDP